MIFFWLFALDNCACWFSKKKNLIFFRSIGLFYKVKPLHPLWITLIKFYKTNHIWSKKKNKRLSDSFTKIKTVIGRKMFNRKRISNAKVLKESKIRKEKLDRAYVCECRRKIALSDENYTQNSHTYKYKFERKSFTPMSFIVAYIYFFFTHKHFMIPLICVKNIKIRIRKLWLCVLIWLSRRKNI